MRKTTLVSALAILTCFSPLAGQGQYPVNRVRIFEAFLDLDGQTIEIIGENFDSGPESLSVLQGRSDQFSDITPSCMVDVSAQPQRISCGLWSLPDPDNDFVRVEPQDGFGYSYTAPISRRERNSATAGPAGARPPGSTQPIHPPTQGKRPLRGLRVAEAFVDSETHAIQITGEDFEFEPGTLAVTLKDFGDISNLCRVEVSRPPQRIICDLAGRGLPPELCGHSLIVSHGGHSCALSLCRYDPTTKKWSVATGPQDPPKPPGSVRPAARGWRVAGLQVTGWYLNAETQVFEIAGENLDSGPAPLTVSLKGFGDISNLCRVDLSKRPHRIRCDFPDKKLSPETHLKVDYYELTLSRDGQSGTLQIEPTIPNLRGLTLGMPLCQTILLHGLPDPLEYAASRYGIAIDSKPEAVPPHRPCPCNVPAVIRADDWPVGAEIRVACTKSCTAAVAVSNPALQPYLAATKQFSLFQGEPRHICDATAPLRWLARPPGVDLEQLGSCSYAMLDYLRELRSSRPDLVFTGDDLDACQPILNPRP